MTKYKLIRGSLDPLLEKIMQKTAEALYIDKHKLSTSASIGISLYPDDGSNTEQLMRNADTAMYYAKEHGRHKYHFYTHEMTATSYDRLALEAELKQAIENKQLLVYYQRQICLQTGKITGTEALVRWRHPELGIMPPAQFLDLAEQCGSMIKIGETVLTMACRQMTRWKGIIKETQRSIETLQQLRDLGLSLAIDDFGTGYSSLSYLKKTSGQQVENRPFLYPRHQYRYGRRCSGECDYHHG